MDSRLKSSVFNSCFSPIKVVKNNKELYVPCGHCAACLNKRAKRLTGRVIEECKASRYTLFFTLTYDNAHIPLVRYHAQYNRWIPDYLKPCVPIKGSDSDMSLLRYPESYMLPSCFGKDAFIPRIHNYHDYSVFGCVSRQDLVLFVKRLRVNLNTLLNQEIDADYRTSLVSLLDKVGYKGKVTYYQIRKLLLNNESFKKSYYDLKRKKIEKKRAWRAELFRYFIVSEYGPAHQDGTPSYHRPHYHGLLFVEDDTILRLLPCAIRKSWTLCDSRNIDTSLVEDQKAAGYVAKYVTGNSTLPAILKTKLTRTFYISSRRPAVCFLSYTPERLTEMYERRVVTTFEQRYKQDGTCEYVDVSVPQFVLSRYFPKCKGYGSLSFTGKLRIYSRFYAPNPGDKELTKSFYKGLSVYPKYEFDSYSGLNRCHIPSEFCVSDITAARACSRWCDIMKCTPERYLEVMDFFYYKNEMYKLEQQFLLADKYNKILYDMCMLDNLPRQLDPECTTLTPLGISDDMMRLRFSSVGAYIMDITGCDVSVFYDDDGRLDLSLLDEFREQNQQYYSDYKHQVNDDILLSNKSKVLNDSVLNNTY